MATGTQNRESSGYSARISFESRELNLFRTITQGFGSFKASRLPTELGLEAPGVSHQSSKLTLCHYFSGGRTTLQFSQLT